MNALQFVTHNNATEIETGGSCLQGHVTASFSELKAVFGEPHESDEYKSDAGWDLRFGDGTIATIYNWKDGPNYNGKDGTPVEQITDWHVGGFDQKAVGHVEVTLQLHREMREENKGPVDELLSSTKDILDSLESKRGRGFARSVYVAHLVKKQMDLFALVMSGAEAGEKAPDGMSELLGGVMANLSAHIISEVTDMVGVCDNRSEAREMMQWVDRLGDNESSAIHRVIADFRNKEARS